MDRQNRSTKILSRHAPRPSMLICTPRDFSASVNTSLVNWAALVGVEDLGLAVLAEGLLERLHAERGVHADRYPVRQHSPACPVHDRAQIDPAASHRDVRYIARPHLVGTFDLEPAKQVRIDLVGRVP